MSTKTMFNDPSWFVMEVKIKLRNYLMRFRTLNKFYRLLSQSEYVTAGETNRKFFKSRFTHGWYRVIIDKEIVRFIFILKVKDLSRIEKDQFHLIWRTRKLINSPVLIYRPEELTTTDRILLTQLGGNMSYRKILGSRKEKI
ncbi:MAG: hypothetical protein FJX80_16115 [Bacteroidetes bacterium]|nr:hypothetical protein [Bacteroidota bacterium]